jgi:hypothetical protein
VSQIDVVAETAYESASESGLASSRSLSETQKTSLRVAEDGIYRAGGFEQLLVPLWKQYIEAHPAEFFVD